MASPSPSLSPSPPLLRTSPMTARAVAKSLRTDLATVVRLIRHEVRDVPLQPEEAPLTVVYEDDCVMAVGAGPEKGEGGGDRGPCHRFSVTRTIKYRVSSNRLVFSTIK